MSTKTIVFVHGLFLTAKSWTPWANYFEAKGYQTHAIEWPLREKPIDELRRAHPDPKLGDLTLDEVIAKHEKEISALPEKPILIGHSLGGLMVQILLQKNLAAGGIAIDSAPPQGLLSFKWSFIKSNWKALNPLYPSSRPYYMSFPDFQYTFINGQPESEQRRAYDDYVVPESVRVQRGVLGKTGQVDYSKLSVPLLMIAGEIDNIIPASLNRANYAKYSAAASKVDFKEFPGRSHFGVGDPNWREMADYVHRWIVQREL